MGVYASASGQGGSRGFLLNPEGSLIHIDFPGAAATYPFKITHSGRLILGSYQKGGSFSFLSVDGLLRTLVFPGTDGLHTIATAVNNYGDVAGSYSIPAARKSGLFVYNAYSGQYLDIPLPGLIAGVVAINESGQIAGNYVLCGPKISCHTVGFVATPAAK